MTLEKLQSDKVVAIKDKDYHTRDVISGMIDAVQKAAITPKGRIDITEQLVNTALIKYQKSVQEQVDTCPEARADLLVKYQQELEVVKQYAPQLLADEDAIKARVEEIAAAAGIELVKASRGALMKALSADLKGKADMKVVSAIVAEVLQ